ncbi:MAG: aminotransferase class I/II-fold pyridoxal phosphate-dependent enzyme [Planctomycetota bacterium]|nr:aminotransferase class I/II-fold pyridoxal phosphate-dependent enzyme [Planctomycetota bacterium]
MNQEPTNQQPFKIDVSGRIARLPPYLFGRINKMKYDKRVAGVDIIDLGMGNPTDPTPESVIEKLSEAARDPRNHRYSVSNGVAGLRKEVAKKYQDKYGVTLDPETEVIATIGSKEGFSHLCLALLGPGDTAIVPDPAFPIHIYAVAMAGANVIRVPLGNDQAFLDRIEKMIEGMYPTPKLLILNYPHNPTAMTIDAAFWDRAIALCRKHGIMIISDFAYGEVCFDGYKAPSFLAANGAKELGVEFTTMSKSYNMAGWRIGFCAGNAQMVKALATIKGYYDYGIFAPIQIASIIAMREHANVPAEQSKLYEHRRDVVCRGLDRLGWTYEKPRASMFVWAKIKEEHLKGEGTIDFCLRMMDEAAVALAPGGAFGEAGETFVRIALVENDQRLRQAMQNLERALIPRLPKPKRQDTATASPS